MNLVPNKAIRFLTAAAAAVLLNNMRVDGASFSMMLSMETSFVEYIKPNEIAAIAGGSKSGKAVVSKSGKAAVTTTSTTDATTTMETTTTTTPTMSMPLAVLEAFD